MKIFKSRCYNGGNQHKFKARYSEKSSNWNTLDAKNIALSDLKALMALKVYECDVCVWCGKIISKQPKQKEKTIDEIKERIELWHL